MSRYVSLDEKAVEAPLEVKDLDRKIVTDGRIVTVRQATKEQFDIFVYESLYQMYDRKKRAENRYELSFWEHDYAEPFYRVLALNKLRQINQERMAAPYFKPSVPLFVEEEVHV